MTNTIEVTPTALAADQAAQASKGLATGIRQTVRGALAIDKTLRLLVPHCAAVQSLDPINDALASVKDAGASAVKGAVLRFASTVAFTGVTVNDDGLLEPTEASNGVIALGNYTGQTYKSIARGAADTAKPLSRSDVSAVVRHAAHGIKGAELSEAQAAKLTKLSNELAALFKEVTGKDAVTVASK